MKKILPVMIILAVAAYFFFTHQTEPEISLAVNGEHLVLETPVKQEDGTFLVPAEPVFRALGFMTAWDDAGEIFSAGIGDLRIDLPVGSNVVSVDGLSEEWAAPVQVRDGVVYMPLEAEKIAAWALVEWDEQERLLAISTPPDFNPFREEEEAEEQKVPPSLTVGYPPGSPTTYYGDSLFVFGSTDAGDDVTVTVNDMPVDIHDAQTGNFLTMVDIPRGEEYPIVVEAAGPHGATTIKRSVLYPAAWEKMAREPLIIDQSFAVPAENQALTVGEILRVAVQGSPGAEASFSIGGQGRSIAMTELAAPSGPPGEGGIYTADYTVTAQDVPGSGVSSPAAITVTLRREGREVSRELPGKVSLSGNPVYRVIEVKPEAELKNIGWLYMVREGPVRLHSETLGGAGATTNVVGYLNEGTRFEAVGTAGNLYRIRLDGGRTHLIYRNAVRVIDGKTALEPTLTSIALSAGDRFAGGKTVLTLEATERFPFLVQDGKTSIGLKIFGAEAAPGLTLPGASGAVKDLKLRSGTDDCPDSMLLTLELTRVISAFSARWEGTNLVLSIDGPPEVDRDHPLRGKTIIVDPGHGGRDTGAPGPGEVHEKDVVLAMSLHLRDMLVKEGAKVIMTRDEDIFVPLYDRPERIDEYKADLFISVHANAHAHNARATELHGLMILYNYAHNEALAEIMLQVMAEKTELHAFRTWRRNIAVLRHPQIPSVLVEAGYMMHPEDNRHIFSEEGQKKFALAMKEGIKAYFLSFDNENRN